MKMLTGYASGTRGFLQWVKTNQPAVYNRALPKLSRVAGRGQMAGFFGLGLLDPTQSAATTAAPKSFADNVKDILLAASQVYLTKEQMQSQQKILDMQLQRAQMGLQPLDIDMSQYGIQPAQVNVGVADSTMKTGGLILAGVAGLFLLTSLFGGRRRR